MKFPNAVQFNFDTFVRNWTGKQTSHRWVFDRSRFFSIFTGVIHIFFFISKIIYCSGTDIILETVWHLLFREVIGVELTVNW